MELIDQQIDELLLLVNLQLQRYHVQQIITQNQRILY